MEYVAIFFFCGLSAAVIGKIKGSSFVIWFLVGAALPIAGTIAALFYRWERDEHRRRCERCGRVVKLHDQVCMTCGEDLVWPDQLV